VKLGRQGDANVDPAPGALKPRQRLPAAIAAKVHRFMARDAHQLPRSVQPLNPGFALLERMRAEKTTKVRGERAKVRGK
jgi:hypothetical protein